MGVTIRVHQIVSFNFKEVENAARNDFGVGCMSIKASFTTSMLFGAVCRQ
jgi:hypothetical protein